MTTSNATTKSITRTMPVMKNAEIKKAAHKQGFTFSRLITCPDCRAEVQTIFGKTVPPWVNVGIALMFTKKKHHSIVACSCGHRSLMKMTFKNIDKVRCKVRGCNHVLNKADSDGLCYPCRKEIAGGGNPARYSQYCTAKLTKDGCLHYMQGGNADCVRVRCPNYQAADYPEPTQPPTTDVKICNRSGCNNPVPTDRKAVCYECVPPRTEVIM